MNGLWWLILGVLVGWLIELAIDYRFWRRQAKATAAQLAGQQSALDEKALALDRRQSELAFKDEELGTLQVALAAKDAEMLGLARRIEERSEEVARLEQAMDKRRADLDRMGLTLNEREKDIGARSEKLKAAEVDFAGRDEKLQAAEADVTRRVAVVSNRESAMQNWEERILAREREVGDRETELVSQAATAADLRADLDAVKGLLRRQYRSADGSDDLQAIEGIGPKIANLLHNADIRSFERLAETSLGELSRILEAGGSRFGLADPLTWAEQASFLFNGEYVAFERMKQELIGGKRRDADLLKQAELSGTATLSSGTAAVSSGTAALVSGAVTPLSGTDVPMSGRPAPSDGTHESSAGTAASSTPAGGAADDPDGDSGRADQAGADAEGRASGTVLTEGVDESGAGKAHE